MSSKQIAYRNGLVTFAVPADWVEEYDEDGGGVFYEDVDGSGTLRLDVATLAATEQVNVEAAVELVKAVADVDAAEVERLANGNVLARASEQAEEDGEPVTLYWWYLGSPLPPELIRLAVYSYTVPRAREAAPETTAERAMLEQAIREARFLPGLAQGESIAEDDDE